jgi:hypothetical protein
MVVQRKCGSGSEKSNGGVRKKEQASYIPISKHRIQ